MKAHTILKLGRVSNLPTVWTNVAAGLVLAGGVPQAWTLVRLALAASALYVGGMFLNDAYDADIDARERPERPIPSGEVSRAQVVRWGYGWLALGLALVATVHVRAVLATLATCGLIVLYDRWHKGNPLGPVIMGLCRVGLYAIAALCVEPTLDRPVLLGSLLLLGYVLGLTYVAKFEGRGALARLWPLAGLFAPLVVVPSFGLHPLGIGLCFAFSLWVWRSLVLVRKGGPAIREAVVSLIAGIALLDALLIAVAGHPGLALLAVAAFRLTLGLQRWVAGT